jgi:hypothetical protein
MGVTVDVLRGRLSFYVTCDNCGHPILGKPEIDPPSGVRDYPRYAHPAGQCPEPDAESDEVRQ